MSNSPLFPWQAVEAQSPLTQEIKDPNSQASITLPRLNGLAVNEIMFAQWAVKQYGFLRSGLSGDVLNRPGVLADVAQFCYRFLCLRLGWADWHDGELLFEGEPISINDALTMPLPDGQKKAAPATLLLCIYGFFFDEQAAFLGKQQSRMMTAIAQDFNLRSTGETSTGKSNEPTQDTPDSPEKISPAAPPTSSSKPSKATEKPAGKNSRTTAV